MKLRGQMWGPLKHRIYKSHIGYRKGKVVEEEVVSKSDTVNKEKKD